MHDHPTPVPEGHVPWPHGHDDYDGYEDCEDPWHYASEEPTDPCPACGDRAQATCAHRGGAGVGRGR